MASKQYVAAVRLALRLNQPSRMRGLAAEILTDTTLGQVRTFPGDATNEL